MCSCGKLENHPILVRTSADDQKLTVWDDGTITHGRMGAYLRGLGTPRYEYARVNRRRAVMLMADDFALYNAAEIPALVKCAQATYAHTYASEDLRRAHVKRTFEK